MHAVRRGVQGAKHPLPPIIKNLQSAREIYGYGSLKMAG